MTFSIIHDNDNQVKNKMSGNDDDNDNNDCCNLSLFQPVVASSSPNDGRRVNYFLALVGSLLQDVTFIPGTFAKRMLINRNTGRAWGVECCQL